jgi:hypothetical protein
MSSPDYRYDAFISHAVEDKIPIANELCDRLEQAGLRIWYSGKELNTGDSINATIQAGLDESRFGVVIFSKHYIRKTWTLREFYILLGKEKDGRRIILPVLYEVTPEELALKDLVMADRFAIKADGGMDHVVDKLVKVIHHQGAEPERHRKKHARWAVVGTALVGLVIVMYGFYELILKRPAGLTNKVIQHEIQARVDYLQHKVDHQYLEEIRNAGAQPSESKVVNTLFSHFRDLKSYHRNEYEFFNGYTTIRARKNVEAALHIDLLACEPVNSYRLHSPAVFFVEKKPHVRYAFVNTQPVHYDMSAPEAVSDGAYAVTVSYENNIRLIAVNLTFVSNPQEIKRHRMLLVGFLPRETYVFEENDGIWTLAEVR